MYGGDAADGGRTPSGMGGMVLVAIKQQMVRGEERLRGVVERGDNLQPAEKLLVLF